VILRQLVCDLDELLRHAEREQPLARHLHRAALVAEVLTNEELEMLGGHPRGDLLVIADVEALESAKQSEHPLGITKNLLDVTRLRVDRLLGLHPTLLDG